MGEIFAKPSYPKKFALVPGSVYRWTKDTEKGVEEVKIFDPIEDVAYLFWKNKKSAGNRKEIIHYQIKTIRLRGRINGSLITSLKSLVPDDMVAQKFMDAYVFDYRLCCDIRRNAQFELVFEQKFDGDYFIKNGDVLYTKLDIKNQLDERFLVRFSDGFAYMNPVGNYSERYFFSPVNKVSVSSLFQKRRFHPIKKYRRAHLGIDYALPEGEPVLAAQAGRIVKKGRNRAAGKFVAIQHPNGLTSFYNHMKTIDDTIKIGDYVFNGQAIGQVGCTGYCTQPHLHFSIKKGNQYLNPIKFVKPFQFMAKTMLQEKLPQLVKNYSLDKNSDSSL